MLSQPSRSQENSPSDTGAATTAVSAASNGNASNGNAGLAPTQDAGATAAGNKRLHAGASPPVTTTFQADNGCAAAKQPAISVADKNSTGRNGKCAGQQTTSFGHDRIPSEVVPQNSATGAAVNDIPDVTLDVGITFLTNIAYILGVVSM